MSAEWDDLARLAEAATPGPWFANWAEAEAAELKPHESAVLFDGYKDCDAKFFAAANPATILRLIEALREASRQAADWQRVAAEQTRLERDRAEAAEDERDALAARLAAVEALADQWAVMATAIGPDTREWLDAASRTLRAVLSAAPPTPPRRQTDEQVHQWSGRIQRPRWR